MVVGDMVVGIIQIEKVVLGPIVPLVPYLNGLILV
jgi:hypothetical protein